MKKSDDRWTGRKKHDDIKLVEVIHGKRTQEVNDVMN